MSSMTRSETGAQLFARLGSRPNFENMEPKLFPSGLQQKDVIEIAGTEGTGKTEILLHFLTQIILPKVFQDVEMNGLEAKVIFIDLDYKFSTVRLALILEKRIIQFCESCKKCVTTDEVEGVIRQCLSRCDIIRCCSSQQLIVTLESLQKVVSEDSNIAAIFIDSISAFYWLDKCSYGDNLSMLASYTKMMTDSISKLIDGYSLVLIVTKALFFKKSGKTQTENMGSKPSSENSDECASNKSHIEFMPRPWENFVKKRFVVERWRPGAHKEKMIFSIKSTDRNIPITVNFDIDESGINFN